MKRWMFIGLLSASVHAESHKIDLPSRPSEPAPAEETAAAAEPISTTLSDPKNKAWKEYDNRIVKAHLRVNSAWTVMELKETQECGSVSFTLSRSPLVTFSITREPMTGSFEEYVSASSLTSLYPSGYQKAGSVLAGRKATRLKGTAPDGRFDESYFSAQGRFISQVSFAAPKESWKEYRPLFSALKESFRWLP